MLEAAIVAPNEVEDTAESSDFYSGEFPEIPIPVKPEDFDSKTEGERSRINNELLLYKNMREQMIRLHEMQLVFEKHGVPLVITRSRSLYLWALALGCGKYIQISDHIESPENIDLFFADVDYLVPAETPEDIEKVEAALRELADKNIIELVSLEESRAKSHPHDFKSTYFRELTLLPRHDGEEKIEIDLFGKFGAEVGLAGGYKYEMLQSVDVVDGEVVVLESFDQLPEDVVDKDLRRGKIGEVPFYYIVGGTLLASYLHERRKIAEQEMSRSPEVVSELGLDAFHRRAKKIASKYNNEFKLRLIRMFHGIELGTDL